MGLNLDFLTDGLEEHCNQMAAAADYWGEHLERELDRPPNARNAGLVERLQRAQIAARAEANIAARNPKAFLPVEMILVSASDITAVGGEAPAAHTVRPVVALVVGVSGAVEAF